MTDLEESAMDGPKRWPWDYPGAILSVIGMVTAVVAIVLSVISIIASFGG